MQTTNEGRTEALKRFQAYWGGRPYVQAHEVSELLFGWSPKTTRNKIYEDRFPVRTVQFEGGKHMCLVEDVACYVARFEAELQSCDESCTSPANGQSSESMPKRGRPTRAEESAARNAGYPSVAAWRRGAAI